MIRKLLYFLFGLLAGIFVSQAFWWWIESGVNNETIISGYVSHQPETRDFTDVNSSNSKEYIAISDSAVTPGIKSSTGEREAIIDLEDIKSTTSEGQTSLFDDSDLQLVSSRECKTEWPRDRHLSPPYNERQDTGESVVEPFEVYENCLPLRRVCLDRGKLLFFQNETAQSEWERLAEWYIPYIMTDNRPASEKAYLDRKLLSTDVGKLVTYKNSVVVRTEGKFINSTWHEYIGQNDPIVLKGTSMMHSSHIELGYYHTINDVLFPILWDFVSTTEMEERKNIMFLQSQSLKETSIFNLYEDLFDGVYYNALPLLQGAVQEPVCFERFLWSQRRTPRPFYDRECRWGRKNEILDALPKIRDAIFRVTGNTNIYDQQKERNCKRPQLTWVHRDKNNPRGVENIDELLSAFSEYFDVTVLVLSQEVPLGEMIEAIQETDVLIGIHGAGLTNGMFLRHGAALVELWSHFLTTSKRSIDSIDTIDVYRNTAALANVAYFRSNVFKHHSFNLGHLVFPTEYIERLAAELYSYYQKECIRTRRPETMEEDTWHHCTYDYYPNNDDTLTSFEQSHCYMQERKGTLFTCDWHRKCFNTDA